MEQLHTSVMLMTESHRLVGRVVTVDQRLQEIINNKLTASINLYDVQLFRPHECETPIAQFAEITLPKTQINLILHEESTYEAPTKRLYTYVPKDIYPIFVTITGYEIQGQLHLTSRPKAEAILNDTSTTFLPITQATVTSVAGGNQEWNRNVVFVRRAAIALMHVETP
jgi:hypothetical protein